MAVTSLVPASAPIRNAVLKRHAAYGLQAKRFTSFDRNGSTTSSRTPKLNVVAVDASSRDMGPRRRRRRRRHWLGASDANVDDAAREPIGPLAPLRAACHVVDIVADRAADPTPIVHPAGIVIAPPEVIVILVRHVAASVSVLSTSVDRVM